MKKYTLIILSLFTLWACKEDDKLFEPQTESELGALIRFANSPRPATIAADDPTNFTFTQLLEDPNGTVADYKIAVLNSSGEYVDLGIILTSFPSDLVLTADMLASALQEDASSFVFGKTFNFRGTLTSTSGVVYSGEPQNFDATTGIITGGNSDLTNIGDLSSNYRDALQFPLTIACPSITDTSSYTGTFSVVSHTYGAFGFASETGIQINAGPGANQITIVNGIYSLLGSSDLILDIDLNLGTTTVNAESVGDAAWNAFGLNATYVAGGGTGLALECSIPQQISFNLQTDCCIDNIVVIQKEE